MKTMIHVVILLIFGAILIWRPSSLIAQENKPVGIVLEVHPPVFLISNTEGKEILLDSSRDKGRLLYPGQSLRCGSGGSLRLQMNGDVKDLAESDGKFVITENTKLEEGFQLNEKQKLINEALQCYGQRGGTRDIGISPMILCPASGSVVRSSHLVIHWIPFNSEKTVTIKIQTESGLELWRQERIAGTVGVLDSDDARKKLISYQTGGGQQEMSLSMTDPDGNELRVTFTLLPLTAEQEFDHELSLWEEETNDLVRCVGRTYTFNRYHMFFEVTQEYEAALAIAPKSMDLLQAAIAAHHRIGNYIREEELKKRMAIINK